QEQVRGDLIAPRRRLDDGSPVVRGELDVLDHRHLATAVGSAIEPSPTAGAPATATAPTASRSTAATATTGSTPATASAASPVTVGRAVRVVRGRRHRRPPPRNDSAAAPSRPTAATPAVAHMPGKSFVATRGSGGRP